MGVEQRQEAHIHTRSKMKLFTICLATVATAAPTDTVDWSNLFADLQSDLSGLMSPLTDSFVKGVSAFVDDFKPKEKTRFSTEKFEPKPTVPPSTTTRSTVSFTDDLVPSESESDDPYIEPSQASSRKLAPQFKSNTPDHEQDDSFIPVLTFKTYNNQPPQRQDALSRRQEPKEPETQRPQKDELLPKTTKRQTTPPSTTTTTTTSTTTTQIRWNESGHNDWNLMCENKRHDEAHAHPFQCNAFIYCWEGRGFEIHCPPNMNFNAIDNRCDTGHACL